MPKSYFITSCGTGIGKTLVTSMLCGQLKAQGSSVMGLKPVVTGWDEEDLTNNDTYYILKSLDLPVNQKHIYATSPFRFRLPVSPDIAAKREKRQIDFQEVLSFCKPDNYTEDYLLIEGVGGVMVPLNDDKTVLDLMAELKIPVIMVTGNYLGSISHSLTAIEALKTRGITPHAVILSESPNAPVSPEEAAASIKRFTNLEINVLPLFGFGESPWEEGPNITGVLD